LSKPDAFRPVAYRGEDWRATRTLSTPKREAPKDEIRRVIDFTKLESRPRMPSSTGDPSYLDIELPQVQCRYRDLVANLDSFHGGHNYCLTSTLDEQVSTSFRGTSTSRWGLPFPRRGGPYRLSLTNPYGRTIRPPTGCWRTRSRRGAVSKVLKELGAALFRQENSDGYRGDVDKVVSR